MRPGFIEQETTELLIASLIGLAGILLLIFMYWWFSRRTLYHRLRPAISHINQGHYSQAAVLLGELEKEIPQQLAISVLQAWCFQLNNAYHHALDAANRVQELLQNPETATSRYFASFLKQQPGYDQLSYQQAALQWTQDTMANLKILQAYQAENYRLALNLTEQRIGVIKPHQVFYLAWKAHFLILMKDLARAGMILEQAESMHTGEVQVPVIRGHWYLVQGEVEKAKELYRTYPHKKYTLEDLHHIEKVYGIQPPEW